MEDKQIENETSNVEVKVPTLSPAERRAEIRLKREVADRLAYAIVALFDTQPLYYQMLSHMARVECSTIAPEIKTIAVGFMRTSPSVVMFYDHRYLAKCSDAKLRVLLIHEMQHVGLKHLIAMNRHEKRIVANIAADVIVNSNIPEYKTLPKHEQDGITQEGTYSEHHPDPTKRGQLMFPSLAGLDLREESIDSIYARLMEHPEETREMEAAMKGGWVITDDHSGWDGRPLTPEEQAMIKDLLTDAVRGLHGRDPGSVPGSMRRLVEELRKVKTDWKPILNMFAQTVAKEERETSWRRVNRRLGPTAQGPVKSYRSRLLVVIDNSGSISGPLYTMFMSHILVLSKMCEEVAVIGVDTAVNCTTVIKDGKMPKDFDLKSGGGTEFQPAFDYAKGKEFDGVIYLTDGCGPAPTNTYRIPTLFAICPNGQKVPGFKNISID
jgi:predicted metal-dependent peptidase